MPIRLQVLGGLHAFRDDVPLAWVPAQHISSAILVYLALERDVTREQLARVFWPDEELEGARHALRQALYRLRHAAGDGLIEDAGDVLRLSVPLACDALDFECAVEGGDFGAAMALYGGAFLKDVSLSESREFEAWMDRQRARFGRLYRRACRARIETLLGAGEMHLALDAARAWATAEPFDDEAQHRLVELLAGSGQRAEALAQYERYERLLDAEELEPLDETKALVAMLRAGEAGNGAILPVSLSPVGLAAPVTVAPALPGGGLTPLETRPMQAVSPAWRRRLALAAVGLAVLVIVVGLVVFRLLLQRPLNVTASNITAVTTEPGVEYQPAISPDGREVAYAAGAIGAPRLVIRSTANVAGGGEVRLADSSLQFEWLPSWSRDGDRVRFNGCRSARLELATAERWGDCTWHETGKLGGAVRPALLPPRARSSSDAAWSPDGTRVAFVVSDTIFTTAVGDTAARQVTVHTTDYVALHSLAWSPDGKRIAYVNTNFQWLVNGNVLASSIWVASADGGEPQPVVTDDHINVSPAWLDTRHLLFVSNRDGPRGLYVVEVTPAGARAEPRSIAGITDPHSISYSVGARKLAWAKFTARQNVWSYPLDRAAPVSIADGQAVTSGSEVIGFHDVSPDGRWLAFDSNRRGKSDIFKVPLAGGEIVTITDQPKNEWDPRWSPDGREIAYYIDDPACAGGLYEVAVIPAEGGVSRELTCTPGQGSYYPRWSPDGLSIAFFSYPERRLGIWAVSRDSVGGAWDKAVQLTDFEALPGAWAPDGRGVLGMSLDGAELFIVALNGQVLWRHDLAGVNGLTGGPGARYSRDGRTIYFAAVHRDGRQGIWALPAAGGPARQVIAFDDPALASPFGGMMLSIGPDRLYLTVAEYQSDIWVADLRH